MVVVVVGRGPDRVVEYVSYQNDRGRKVSSGNFVVSSSMSIGSSSSDVERASRRRRLPPPPPPPTPRPQRHRKQINHFSICSNNPVILYANFITIESIHDLRTHIRVRRLITFDPRYNR